MRTIDLFAGCGGLSQGFQNAGFDIVAAFELWGTAADCYEANFSHPVYRNDLSKVEAAVEIIKGFRPSLIIGGPPCQDFSHAGKRVESGRAELTEAYASIIKLVRPQYFVMENVDRTRKSKAFALAKEIFKQAGYGLTQIVLDASHCGVPQKRKRFFCIGALNETDGFAESHLLSGLSEKETTLRDYFGDTLDFEFYYRHPRNYNRRAVFSIDEPAPTMRGVNRPVPKGYPGHANDACPVHKNVRALTTLERALIQTFPPNYKWCGNKTEMEQMIGNAVPVKLAEFVANALKAAIEDNLKIALKKEAFTAWLISEYDFSERSAKDTVSRVRRADRMCQINQIPDAYYLYRLCQNPNFRDLSVSVKSQIKRATTLYGKYLSMLEESRTHMRSVENMDG